MFLLQLFQIRYQSVVLIQRDKDIIPGAMTAEEIQIVLPDLYLEPTAMPVFSGKM